MGIVPSRISASMASIYTPNTPFPADVLGGLEVSDEIKEYIKTVRITVYQPSPRVDFTTVRPGLAGLSQRFQRCSILTCSR